MIRESHPQNNPKALRGKQHTETVPIWLGERHSTTLQCMRLMDHMTLNFNNNMSTAAVFLHVEKALDTTWHPGLLYKRSELHFLLA